MTNLFFYKALGFNLEPKTDASVQIAQKGTDWVHARARMSASDLAKPIPQFGSQAHSQYDIVCVWERPGADTMSAWLRGLRLDSQSVIVFYLGRLTPRQRHDWARRARGQELVIAVLDESLLVFLAQERDARLPIFLRCTLPFAAANPYTPFQAGDVPPEMFFGRNAMARELQRASGSCLVYGGRQLGKSALLQHVRREFHHPEREQYAWVEDIELLGDPRAGQPPDVLWAKIREGFKSLGLLQRSITTDSSPDIARYVRDAMFQKSERRILMLFDEADNFLDADAKDRFRVVEALRALMLDTGRRLKVVFAGLHNVQRFQGIPNQPLAQFGTPLLVGPLEPAAAQRLVREPIEVLGFRFADDGAALRILSYTNYHPGLIQLFCQELLRRLNNRIRSTFPPYSIEQNDIEAVYLLPQVRDTIRERFDWTLALDTRYQAIAWGMIYDQMGTRDGYAQSYAPGDLLQIARGWWPQGFNELDPDQLRGLLEEMRGLGVLVRDSRGYYRLRSPNLVRLMGTDADIENRLLNLSYKEPEVTFDADSHHAPLDVAARRYSPLTYAQERLLNSPRFGVALVFASEALGLSQLEPAFKRFIPPHLPEGVKADFMEIPPNVTNEDLMEMWLGQYLREHQGYERLILYRTFRGVESSPSAVASTAIRVCQRHERSKKQWLRILFLFDPSATWAWLSQPKQIRRELEERVDSVAFPRRWNLSGIRQRLVQQDKMASEEVCREVLRVTGGWPYLLELVFDRCGSRDDSRPAVKTIERELSDGSTELAKQFRAALGVNDTARRVLEFVDREQGLQADLVVPDLVGGDPPLTNIDCEVALEYLQRMNCIEVKGESVSVELTIRRTLAWL